MQVSRRLIALGAASAILFAACGGSAATTAPTTSSRVDGSRVHGPRVHGPRVHGPRRALNTDYKACVAFDTGGLGDKGFNDLAKKGLDDAAALGYQTASAEAQGATDYEANIQRLIDQGCQTIVTVGFLQGSATAKATLANPDIAFGQVDATWNSAGDDFTPGTADDPPPGVPANFTGLDYQVDQAAMLAGYLAASWSKSGKVATYGGLAFPGVTRFMDGFYAGVQYHNQQKGTAVEVLGWDGSLEDPRPPARSSAAVAAPTPGTTRPRASRSPRRSSTRASTSSTRSPVRPATERSRRWPRPRSGRSASTTTSTSPLARRRTPRS